MTIGIASVLGVTTPNIEEEQTFDLADFYESLVTLHDQITDIDELMLTAKTRDEAICDMYKISEVVEKHGLQESIVDLFKDEFDEAGIDLSVEGIGEQIKRAITAIAEFVKKLIQQIVDFAKKFFSQQKAVIPSVDTTVAQKMGDDFPIDYAGILEKYKDSVKINRAVELTHCLSTMRNFSSAFDELAKLDDYTRIITKDFSDILQKYLGDDISWTLDIKDEYDTVTFKFGWGSKGSLVYQVNRDPIWLNLHNEGMIDELRQEVATSNRTANIDKLTKDYKRIKSTEKTGDVETDDRVLAQWRYMQNKCMMLIGLLKLQAEIYKAFNVGVLDMVKQINKTAGSPVLVAKIVPVTK